MLQLICWFLIVAQAQTLELLNRQTLDSEMEIKKVKVGGLSGLHYKNDFLWAISDDRGSRGPYRMYKFELKSSKDEKTWSVKPMEMIPLGESSGYQVLDPEALHLFDDGRFLISSEGDLNKKPRVMPMIRFWSFAKGWEDEVPLPREVLPEAIGMQTQGIHNNSGFEAVAVHEDGKKLWIMPELPLFQRRDNKIDIYEYVFDKKWKKIKSYKYTRDEPKKDEPEILRGMSEALWWKENHLLVLERYLQLQGTDLKKVGAELFSVKLTNGKVEKKKLLSLDTDKEANWEGLSWGPALANGKRLLIIGTDNNFKKNVDTVFSFYSFAE